MPDLATKNNKDIVITGVKPTGILHIGNFLAALKSFIQLQNENKYKCLFFIADLHSLNEDFNPKEKTLQIKNMIIDSLSIGIDPQKTIFFQQSKVPAHSELAILLNNITPIGDLKRMTQFKDRVKKQPENINAGLLYYPILMAADIALYDAKFVPVGEDQLQHLEFARTIIRKFNSRFEKIFIEPQPILMPTKRIMSLNNPLKKMSKSEPGGCLFLDDSPQKIYEKIQKAVTDSEKQIKYDKQKKPAISNLIEIYSGFSNLSIEETEKKFEKASYKEFKEQIYEEIMKTLKEFQKRKKELLKQENIVWNMVKKGNENANKIASSKIEKVKQAMGLI